MTKKMSFWDKVDEYKYLIMYYVYFATCLTVALWLAKPFDLLVSMLS